jgi:hypothetical protein
MSKQLPNTSEVAKNVVAKNVKGMNGVADTVAKNLLDGLGRYRVEYHLFGDFTTAVLVPFSGATEVYVGVSKRNPTDRKNQMRGKSLSLARAVQAYVTSQMTGKQAYQCKQGMLVENDADLHKEVAAQPNLGEIMARARTEGSGDA